MRLSRGSICLLALVQMLIAACATAGAEPVSEPELNHTTFGLAESAEALAKRGLAPASPVPVKLSDFPRPSAPLPAEPAAALVVAGRGVETGAPSNNSCANATAFSGIGSVAFDTSEATRDGLGHFLCDRFFEDQIDRDIWYRWRAPASARFVVDTCTNTFFDSRIAVYLLGTCPPTDSLIIACGDDECSSQTRVTINATNNQEYLIRVGSFPGAPGGPGVLRISYDANQNLCPYPASQCQPRDATEAIESTGLLTIEDFTPTSNSFISGVCVWGTYFNGTGNCIGVSPDSFEIAYYENNQGLPESIPFQTYAGSSIQVVGPIWTGGFIDGVFPEYQYHITHPGVQLMSNRCYWISVRNRLPLPPNGNCSWFWQRGSGGNSIAFQGSLRIARDLALCLSIPDDPPTECATPTPPANDVCSGAILIPCGQTRTFDNLFATTATTDPQFPCKFGGSGQGIGTVWFTFTASGPQARVTLCNNDVGDTLLAVYSGTCSNLTLLACNEDFCGFRSQLCVSGLTSGQTYYIQAAVGDESSRRPYSIQVTCNCPNAPSNDQCTGATLLTITPPFGAVITGSTVNASVDTEAPVCGFSLVSGAGVWYRVVGDGTTYTADTCDTATNFDTKLGVYCGACTQLVCVADNDDGEGSPSCGTRSRVSWCAESGRTYYILLHGFSGDNGSAVLRVRNGTACTGAVGCNTCNYTCPPGAIAENETCGADGNGGCNSFPTRFQSIMPGQTICGRMPVIGVTRDTDWFEFSINTPSVVTWTVQSEAPVDAFIMNNLCPPTLLHTAPAARCGTAVVSGLLAPGTYRLFIGAISDGYSCSSSNDYIATLTSEPVGACCTVSDCRRIPQDDCAAIMGSYAGAGTTCPLIYSPITCANAFENISSTGQRIIVTGDTGSVVPVGFAFRYYGVDYTNVGVSPNGYLSFDPDLGAVANQSFPNVAPPNAVIAPFWDDLAPEAAGTLHYQTLGTTPNRRLVVQWTSVPQFLNIDSNTFQVILFESGGCIEFRYGVTTPQAQPGDYSVGLENQTGSSGTNLDPAILSSGLCRRFCPVLAPGGCASVALCPGDANRDRAVNFPDISSILLNWGRSGPIGDANGDGQVSFPDISSVLLNWGDVCP